MPETIRIYNMFVSFLPWTYKSYLHPSLYIAHCKYNNNDSDFDGTFQKYAKYMCPITHVVINSGSIIRYRSFTNSVVPVEYFIVVVCFHRILKMMYTTFYKALKLTSS